MTQLANLREGAKANAEEKSLAPPRAGQPGASPSRQNETLWGLAVFIGQRLAFGALVLGAITFLSHLGLEMARGAALRPATGWAVRQSLVYLGRLVQGDFGLTQAGSLRLLPIPVAEVLPDIVSKSLGLLAFSLLIATLTGILLGLLAAARRHSRWSLVTILASIVGISLPSFFAALLLQIAMIRWSRAFGSPLLPIGGFGWDKHLILPALVLAARPVAQVARVTFITVGQVLDQDYVRTAHSKGLWPRQIVGRHVLRNAAIPILTTVSLSLRFSLSSLPVVEFFFGWPGLGFTLLRAIARQDDNLTVGLILCLGALFIVINLALELSYRLIDPRLRESVSQVMREERGSLIALAASLLNSLRDLLLDNPLRRWLTRRLAPGKWQGQPGQGADRFSRRLGEMARERQPQLEVTDQMHRAERRRAWLRGTLGNLPFLTGALLVGGLLTIVLIGPRLAPHSPYTTQGLVVQGGEFMAPPFEPGQVYPWGSDVLGRDIMSLILAGAQQTLLLATLVVAARLVVGFVLGALAGWMNGSWIDRGVLALAEIIAAFPTLLLAMILILALGIRQGMRPFVVALCFVGWSEIMQFVRGQVMAIRPQPFIEGAVSVGLRASRIILTHVLPNLLSALIAIAALEMGAVLMLLGELGFVGIFIGGGAFAELDVGSLLYHYSDVPEWASLLSDVRAYARSYPWVAVYPALAFFVAILGFNLFGEGLRRMVETVGVGFSRLFNRYTFALALVVFLGVNWAQGRVGAIAFYRQQAAVFDGQQALSWTETLADPALQGRALGGPGLDLAADAIAQQFEALGLQPAGQEFTYFQNRPRSFTLLRQTPQLAIEDGGPPLTYRQDYAEYPGYYNGVGRAQGPVHVVAAKSLSRVGFDLRYPALGPFLSDDDIVMVLSGQEEEYMRRMPHGGLLVVAEDAAALQRRFTVSGRSRVFLDPLADRQRGEDKPVLWISAETADRLLAGTGATVASLRQIRNGLTQNEVFDLWASSPVSMTVAGSLVERAQVSNVIGHLPGTTGRAGIGDAAFDDSLPGGATQDARGGSSQLDNQMIVVLAQYDSPPMGPEGVWPAANDNASGVAVMLEAIRTMRESGYEPYRTFLFVAYGGEGLDGGEVVRPSDVFKFLQAKAGFATVFDVEAIVNLRGLGAGAGAGLVLAAGGNQRLASLFERAAALVGTPIKRAEQAVDLSIIFEDRTIQEGGGQEAPYVVLNWEGWEATARTPADTLDAISADKLEQAGETLGLALMIMGREERY